MLRDGRLGVASTQTDTMIPGRTHERLAQLHQGMPIFGGELVRQVADGSTLSVFGRLFENVSVASVVPSLDERAAREAAERADGPGAIAGETRLGILPTPGGAVLAYRLIVRSPRDIQTYFVNAQSGAIERHATRIRTDAPAIGTGTGVLNDRKKMSVDRLTNSFAAVDLLRPTALFTLDFHGSLVRLDDFLQTGRVFPSDVAVATTNTWTDGAVVDAHVYQGWVYDYYFKRFGRHGLDDRDIQVVGITHLLSRADAPLYPPEIVGLFINNAGYLGDGFIFYGDGDGQRVNFLAGALDVVGHELSHGVTDYTSRLEYVDESGALNEAFSDIMGTAIEFFFEKGLGPQKGPNFLVGEDVVLAAPGFVRSLRNPIEGGTPDHYSLREFIGTPVDNGGVHVNSTIVSHAFYLAVAGGRNRVSNITVGGIGLANLERMERIFYRGFAFMLTPLSKFIDARNATLQAATDLYGANSNERAQLEQAWTAVGVGVPQ
jgi:Zn-dependent metalloprotease